MYRRKNYDSHRKHKNKMKIKRRRISRVRFFFVSVYIHFSAAPFVILLGSVYPFAIYYFFFSVFRLWWMRHHCVSLSRRNAMRSLLLPRRAERQKKDTLLLLSSAEITCRVLPFIPSCCRGLRRRRRRLYLFLFSLFWSFSVFVLVSGEQSAVC